MAVNRTYHSDRSNVRDENMKTVSSRDQADFQAMLLGLCCRLLGYLRATYYIRVFRGTSAMVKMFRSNIGLPPPQH